MDKNDLNIGIITFPFSKAFVIPLSNLEKILNSLANRIYIITGGTEKVTIKTNCEKTQIVNIRYNKSTNPIMRIVKYIYLQIRVSVQLIKCSKNINLLIFFMEGNGILPMLIAKLLRKKMILALPSKILFNDFQSKLWVFVQAICENLSNVIILYSSNLIQEWNLEKHKNKIFIAHEHYIDFNRFKIKKKFDKRHNLVGYIGRFSSEKGIYNFMNALPNILKMKDDIKFILIGDGEARDRLMQYITEKKLSEKVIMKDWIMHEELSDYLNELKLLILPSYTEGLPNILLEAMACGTPVLATSVGAIPDIINDNENGFLMENNSSESISLNVTRAINHQDLIAIADNTKNLIKKEFSFKATSEKFTKIIEEIYDGK